MEKTTNVENNMQLFRNRLKELRGEKSLQEIAAELGISRATLGYYENGDRRPDIEMLLRIANHYNVSCDYLLGLTDIETPDIDNREICEKLELDEYSLKVLTYFRDESRLNLATVNYLLGCYPLIITLLTDYWLMDFDCACELEITNSYKEKKSPIDHACKSYYGETPKKQIPLSNLGFLDKNQNIVSISKNPDFLLNSYLLEIQKHLVRAREEIQKRLVRAKEEMQKELTETE